MYAMKHNIPMNCSENVSFFVWFSSNNSLNLYTAEDLFVLGFAGDAAAADGIHNGTVGCPVLVNNPVDLQIGFKVNFKTFGPPFPHHLLNIKTIVGL